MIKNNVLIGEDGWLFLYGGAQKQFDYLTGDLSIDKSNVDNFIDNITKRKEYFNEKNIIYKHIIFPSKPLCKIKYLPGKYKNIKSLYENYYECDMSDELKKSIIYPLQLLRNTEKNHSTFLKYNTHNSSLGYLAIVNNILSNIGLEKQLQNSPKTVSKIMLGGDLANMIKSSDCNEEEIINTRLNGVDTYMQDNIRSLPGSTNNILISHTFNAVNNKRLLVFGDSFLKDTLQFLQPFFKDIMYIRSKFVHPDIVDLYSPDIVLTSSAERYLMNIKKDARANNIMLELYGNKFYTPNDNFIAAFMAQLSFKNYLHIYEKWIKTISATPQTDMEQVQGSKILQNTEIDTIRDSAIMIENTSVEMAYSLMVIAGKFRNGSIIKNKLQEYTLKVKH